MNGVDFPGWLVVVTLAFVLWTPEGAAETTSEIISLDLEELLNLEILRREPLGIHHTHDRGEFMLNISTGYMSMTGSGRKRSRALANFMVVPTDMDVEMLMVGAMYAPTGRMTLMAMVPYARKSMDHVTRMGGRFTTESRGLGDVKLSSLITIWQSERAKIHLELGTSVPTGSIDAKDTTPAGRVRLPYLMQLGSGTWDLLSGITFQAYRDKLSWGARANAVFSTDRNDDGYSLGDRQNVSVWGSYLVNNWMSSHIRVDGQHWESIRGADAALNPNMNSAADPDLQTDIVPKTSS